MATNILKSINQSDVPTDFNSVNNIAKIQMTNPSDEDSKYRVESSKQIITIRRTLYNFVKIIILYIYIYIYIYNFTPLEAH
jgi:hypothetical protein